MTAKFFRFGAIVLLTALIVAVLYIPNPISRQMQREAIRHDYNNGRITKDEARKILGETVDTWAEPAGTE